jgi:hypothetical protein
MKNKLTTEHQPESIGMKPVRRLDDEQWTQMGQSVWQLIDLNQGNRGGLEESLNYGNALYEMMGERANPPWDGCANITVPVVFTAVKEMSSRIAGSTLIPRPYSVHGSDAISTQYSHIVEQFYNSEYLNNKWKRPQDTCIELSARDGTAILEVMWEKKISETTQLIDGPVMDESGNPQVDENGQAIIKKQKQTVRKVEYDAVKYTAVELRDFVLFPNYAPSIEEADGVARKIYMAEHDMWAMVEADTFKKEAVEAIMSYVSSAQDERPYDSRGNFTYTIGGKIAIGDYSVTSPEGIKMARGPVEIWQVLTRQYDMDGDGVCEENFIWVHGTSQIMAGYKPYEYEGGRPYFPLALMPRPNRFYGFSVPDVVGSVQEEASAQRNARLDWLDIASNPSTYATPGFKNKGENESRRFGPGVMFEVDTPTDFGFLQLGEPPQALFSEETSLLAMADRSIGAPQTGGSPPQSGGGGKQNSRVMQQNTAMQGMQTNRMIVMVRDWMQDILRFTHLLYVKYGKDQMQMLQASSEGNIEVTVPREILAQNYILGINGQGGPLDKENRRQDAMAVYQMGLQNPLVSSNMKHVYNVTRNLYETFDYPDVTGFIGTMDEAEQLQQQQQIAQQKQQQEQMAMHVIKQTDIGSIHAQDSGQGGSGDRK